MILSALYFMQGKIVQKSITNAGANYYSTKLITKVNTNYYLACQDSLFYTLLNLLE